MKTRRLLTLAVIFIVACSGKKKTGISYFEQPSLGDKGYVFESTPFWSDEFNVNGAPDPTKWSYDIRGSGWGNNELEYYTNSTKNSSIADGKLSI